MNTENYTFSKSKKEVSQLENIESLESYLAKMPKKSNYPAPKTVKLCLYCGDKFNGFTTKKYCSAKCRVNHTVSVRNKINKRLNDLPPSTIGALGELLVCVDLLQKGYEVFRAQSPSCSCDLIASRDDKLFKIEVRTGWYQHPNNRVDYPGERFKADIMAVVTHIDNKIHYIPEL